MDTQIYGADGEHIEQTNEQRPFSTLTLICKKTGYPPFAMSHYFFAADTQSMRSVYLEFGAVRKGLSGLQFASAEHKTKTPPACSRRERLFAVGEGVAAEQQRYAPKRGKRHKRVYHAADRGGLPAAERGDDVKAEQADAAPVYAADYGQSECDAVDYHAAKTPFPLSMSGRRKIIYGNFCVRQNWCAFALYKACAAR